MATSKNKIIIYGGNGFVGTHIAEQLVKQGVSVTCASRSGKRPLHLLTTSWADSVQWLSSDASNPKPELLSGFDTLISTVGSPPVPTFSKKAYERQFFTNGTCNVKASEAAAEAGIKRLILIGAKIPFFLDGDRFAYAKGKRVAREAAIKFSTHSDEHRSIVIQPGGLFGMRHTKGGTKIPLGILMKPLSKLIPSQLLAVEKLTDCIVNACLCSASTLPPFQLIKHEQI